jgi:hypothetical protein
MKTIKISLCFAIALLVAYCGSSECPMGYLDMGGACVDLSSDPDNCGAFGNVCPPGRICQDAVCVLSCPDGMTECSGVCRDLANDVGNCGSCGMTCGAGTVCVDGTCQPDCPEGYTDCSGVCKNLANDPANCGECSNACADGEVCAAGSCSFTCPAPYVDCSGSCADLDTDHLNCGECSNVCRAGFVCSAGSCAVSCYEGLTMCSGACFDLMRDPDNCGACARSCPDGDLCYEGACLAACPGGFTDCSGSCYDLDSDRLNCGACENECGIAEICVAGSCELTCASPLSACSGTCVDLRYDPLNCGSCGSPCSWREACVDGTCETYTGAIGHAVMVGHDYFSSDTNMDNIIGNAVLLANTSGTVNVLGYTECGDTSSSGEVNNTNAAITARATTLGRTVSFSSFTSYSLLDSQLPGNHVLLIYEMERSGCNGSTIGAAWATTLNSFVRSGGVVIACNYFDTSWEIMSSSGLLSISAVSSAYGSSIVVADSTNPIAADVSSYTGMSGSSSYTTTETGIVTRVSGGDPVVIHKMF